MTIMVPYLSVRDAAERLNISPRRVRALIDDGRLAADRVGGRWLIDAADLASLMRHRRSGGRPLSSRNAWALLADLSGRTAAAHVPERSYYRLRELRNDGDRLVRALSEAEPRSVQHSWRVLRSDLERLRNDPRLVLSGLSANARGVDVREQRERDQLDAYVNAGDLSDLEHSLKPEKGSRNANLLLRVPRDGLWILNEARAPAAVAAADLLPHDDPRVLRAARRVLVEAASGN
jgi:excisionase family DNA binding protein